MRLRIYIRREDYQVQLEHGPEQMFPAGNMRKQIPTQVPAKEGIEICRRALLFGRIKGDFACVFAYLSPFRIIITYFGN